MRCAYLDLIPKAISVTARMLVMRRIPVVLRQNIFAPVAVEVAPHAVNVIRVVLSVVVFDQKCAALHTIVVAISFFETAHPGKLDGIETRMADFVQTLARLGLRLRAQMLLDQGHQHSLLLLAELTVGNTLVLLDRRLSLVIRNYVSGLVNVVGRI